MNAIRTLLAVLIFGISGIVLAQTGAGEGLRGSTPPGTSQDGAAPSDGARTRLEGLLSKIPG